MIVVGKNLLRPVPEGATRASANMIKALSAINVHFSLFDIAETTNPEFDDSLKNLVKTSLLESIAALKLKSLLNDKDALYVLNVSKEPFLMAVRSKELLLHFFHSVESLSQGMFRLRKLSLSLRFFRRNNVYIFTSSSRLREHLVTRYGIWEERTFWVPIPIDTSVFKPFDKGKKGEELGLPQDKHVILYPGSLHLYRGIIDVLRNFSYLMEEASKDIILYILAPPRYEGVTGKHVEIVRGLVSKLGLVEKVVFDFGVKKNGELNALYNSADTVLMPFQGGYWVDPPVMLLEALACGAKVITRYPLEEPIGNTVNGDCVAEILSARFKAHIIQASMDKFRKLHDTSSIAKVLKDIIETTCSS